MVTTPTPAPVSVPPTEIIVAGEVFELIEDEAHAFKTSNVEEALAAVAGQRVATPATRIDGADDMTVLDVVAVTAQYVDDGAMRFNYDDPEAGVHDNNLRAALAGTALIAYAVAADNTTGNVETVIGDLLADLRHYCDTVGLNFDAMAEASVTHYTAELHNRF